MFFEEGVSHAWLFPRVAAIMHHGGAGTTAAGLAAGVPSIIFPGASDQHFWGNRIARLGVGPRPLSQRAFTTETLARVFLRVTRDRRLMERAGILGQRVRAENGVARAVAALLPLLG